MTILLNKTSGLNLLLFTKNNGATSKRIHPYQQAFPKRQGIPTNQYRHNAVLYSLGFRGLYCI